MLLRRTTLITTRAGKHAGWQVANVHESLNIFPAILFLSYSLQDVRPSPVVMTTRNSNTSLAEVYWHSTHAYDVSPSYAVLFRILSSLVSSLLDPFGSVHVDTTK